MKDNIDLRLLEKRIKLFKKLTVLTILSLVFFKSSAGLCVFLTVLCRRTAKVTAAI